MYLSMYHIRYTRIVIRETTEDSPLSRAKTYELLACTGRDCLVSAMFWTPTIMGERSLDSQPSATEMRSGSEEGSYLRLIDCCITQL